jgi:hypothetical protein
MYAGFFWAPNLLQQKEKKTKNIFTKKTKKHIYKIFRSVLVVSQCIFAYNKNPTIPITTLRSTYHSALTQKKQ